MRMTRMPTPATTATDYEREGYLGLLNAEMLEGARAARELLDAGVGGRDSLLRANPSWLRVGTFRALLRQAREALDQDPSVALELTAFVLTHVDDVPPPSSDTAFLVTQLRGVAWKEHGNALFMLDRLEDALAAAERAVNLLSLDPFHIVYRASAQVLVALVKHALHHDDEATALLDEATGVFAAHADARGYVVALQVRAMIANENNAHAKAREDYLAAFSEAERLGDEREQSRILHNLGVCAMRMGDIELASEYMTGAFLGFTRLRMDGELQRAIWVTAAIERECGDLEVALKTLHSVYARFLERGMVDEAARVLVQVGDVVTDLTGDLAYAKDMCAKLAVTLGRYDVPAAVRDAVEHLRTASAAARSVAALRAVLGHVAAFLRDYRRGPSEAVFNPLLPE